LEIVACFVKGAEQRREIESYLSICDVTEIDGLELDRERLLELIDRSYSAPSESSNRELGYLWVKFKRTYIEHFAEQHDLFMKSHSLQLKFDEIRRGGDWWEYENLAEIMPDGWKRNSKVETHTKHLLELDCRTDVREALKARPFCTCSFNLTAINYWETLPDRLSAALADSVRETRKLITNNRARIIEQLENIAKNGSDQAISKTVVSVSNLLTSDLVTREISPAELQLLKRAAAVVFASAIIRGDFEPTQLQADVREEVILYV